MAKKVLVVDDDKSTLLLAESILKENGFDVVTLDYPKKALKVIREEKPDLVLLDILMPYKDGYKLCEEIKEGYADKIAVILCTSKPYEMNLIKEAYKEFGADGFLIKPFDRKELTDKVKELTP